MPAHNALPTILIVDDSTQYVEKIARQFLNYTHVGVIKATNLTEAVEIVSSTEIKFDCIYSDMNFEGKGTADLHDGIDFLSWAVVQRPGLITYVSSAYLENNVYKAKAKAKNVEIREWFEKKFHAQSEIEGPWSIVEKELLRIFMNNRGGASEDGANDQILQKPWPTRTYLQSLDLESEICVKKAIEIFCIRDVTDVETTYHASCPILGLSVTGEGSTTMEAIDALKEHIASAYEYFSNQPGEKLKGFASFTKSKLDEYLRPA